MERMTDNSSLALDLISLGWKIFPVDARKRPLLPTGHLAATDDPELAAVWMNFDFPGCGIGVATGPSGIVVADLDRKNNKDAFVSLDDAWLELPPTFRYMTPSGGEHWIYKAPEGKRLNGSANYRGLSGLDRRGGSSYIVFHNDAAPESLTELAEAPLWLTDEADERDARGYGGDTADWLETYAQGEPNARVVAAIDRIKRPDMSHSDMVEDQYNLIRIAAEGSPGVAVALEELRGAWLGRNPQLHSTPQEEWDYKFDEALDSGILKYGQEVQSIKDLPPYLSALDVLPDYIDLDILLGELREKKHFYTVLKALVGAGIDDPLCATILWNAPSVSKWSREWGLDYVYDQITVAKAKNEPVENPSTGVNSGTEVTNSDTKSHVGTLLHPKERVLVGNHVTFVDRYTYWAAAKVNVLNTPYHEMNALTLLSVAIGTRSFIDVEVDNMTLGLFGIAPGDSSTGKSQAIGLRRKILKEMFRDDPGYNLGADASMQYLHKTLLERDGSVAFFNADEAAGVFRQLIEQKWTAGLIEKLTDWYGGYVGPLGRVGDKREEAGKDAIVSFVLAMFGTPRKMYEILTQDMFESGFLARAIWFIGESGSEDPTRFDERRGIVKNLNEEFDKDARAWAIELAVYRRLFGRKRSIGASPQSLKRMTANRKAMDKMLAKHPNPTIIEPSVRRLGDNISKVSALLAIADGYDTVQLVHTLSAIGMAETWLANLVTVAAHISASTFERDCDEIEAWMIEQGGTVTLPKLHFRFRKHEPRDMQARIGSLTAQGRVNESRDNKYLVINGGL